MSMFSFRVDPAAPTAPSEQLRAQVVRAVRSGELAAGTRLPTVRGLADELGLAANTVAKAYRALERDEVIQTRGRSGSFVAASGDAAHRNAQEAAIAYADRIRILGLKPSEALEIVTDALRAEDARSR